MPGWAAAVEAMHRGAIHPDDAVNVSNTVILAGQSLVLLTTSHHASLLCLSGRISLAATMRKIIWPHVQRETPQARDTRLVVWRKHLDREKAWHDKELEGFRSMKPVCLLSALVAALKGLDTLLASMGSDKASSSSGSGSVLSSISTEHAVSDKVPSCVHKLQAITALTLIQVFLWRRDWRCIQDNFHTEQWLDKIPAACNSLLNTDLKNLMTSMLRESPASPISQQQSEVDTLWERYAVTHFQGRWSPGCCNLKCTKLGGVSETALQTLLCAGCMQARYCSVVCQKAAWREGGHSRVCGS